MQFPSLAQRLLRTMSHSTLTTTPTREIYQQPLVALGIKIKKLFWRKSLQVSSTEKKKKNRHTRQGTKNAYFLKMLRIFSFQYAFILESQNNFWVGRDLKDDPTSLKVVTFYLLLYSYAVVVFTIHMCKRYHSESNTKAFNRAIHGDCIPTRSRRGLLF